MENNLSKEKNNKIDNKDCHETLKLKSAKDFLEKKDLNKKKKDFNKSAKFIKSKEEKKAKKKELKRLKKQKEKQLFRELLQERVIFKDSTLSKDNTYKKDGFYDKDQQETETITCSQCSIPVFDLCDMFDKGQLEHIEFEENEKEEEKDSFLNLICFDCTLDYIKKSYNLPRDCNLCYIGSRRFAIIEELKQSETDNQNKIKFSRIISLNNYDETRLRSLIKNRQFMKDSFYILNKEKDKS